MADDVIRRKYMDKIESGELKAKFMGFDGDGFYNFDLVDDDEIYLKARVQIEHVHNDVYIYDVDEGVDYAFESMFDKDVSSDYYNIDLIDAVFSSFKEHDRDVVDVISDKDGNFPTDVEIILSDINSRDSLFKFYDVVSDVYNDINDGKYKLAFDMSSLSVYFNEDGSMTRYNSSNVHIIDPKKEKEISDLFSKIGSSAEEQLDLCSAGSIRIVSSSSDSFPVLGLRWSDFGNCDGIPEVIGSVKIGDEVYNRDELKSFIVDTLRKDDVDFARAHFGTGDFPLENEDIPDYKNVAKYIKHFHRDNLDKPCDVKLVLTDGRELISHDGGDDIDLDKEFE